MSFDIANEFLERTNPVYNECSHGIAILDRIVVATPTPMTGKCRMSLVPSLYAYWERFFRVVLGEYLTTVALSRTPPRKLNNKLARLSYGKAICRNIDHGVTQQLHQKLHEAISAFETEAASLQKKVSDLCIHGDTPVAFPETEKWIDTEANVRFEVIERNLSAIGLSTEELKSELALSNIFLYPRLKDLVDTRNRIAHGETLDEVDSEKWTELTELTLSLMNALQMHLYEALSASRYLSSAS